MSETKPLHLLISVVLLFVLAGCGTLNLPDLGTKKLAGKTYTASKSTILGKPYGGVKWLPMKTKRDELREMLQAPAKAILWIALPTAILAGAAMMFLTSNPMLMKRIGTIAAISLVAAVLASAWLLASMWALVGIPLGLLLMFLLYAKSKGKSIPWLSLD